ncbi:hypothetical protein [Marilutibacter chinensis]|uniref:Uncharacterized protein n=1 Tax=Marilutibacter chinensis TaxID=2912247 RepID=A0ABS9HTP9_9GAMM|nr:hypothetical protein [Lysobacter chinensis]MCF7222276.1 hypothetical protein [Lysobacter chinensis]
MTSPEPGGAPERTDAGRPPPPVPPVEAPSPPAPTAPTVDVPLRNAVLEFSERYLKRTLTEAERDTLERLVADGMRLSPSPPATPDPMKLVADAVRAGQRSIDQTLSQAREDATRQLERAAAGADSETHDLLRLLEKAEDLGSLRPSRLHPGQSSTSHVLMTQIADRLANLVKKEVESLFQTRFGLLAQQLEQALAALSASSDASAKEPSSPRAHAAEAAPAQPPSTKSAAASAKRGQGRAGA